MGGTLSRGAQHGPKCALWISLDGPLPSCLGRSLHNALKRPMADLIFIVKDADMESWHEENIHRHPEHYAGFIRPVCSCNALRAHLQRPGGLRVVGRGEVPHGPIGPFWCRPQAGFRLLGSFWDRFQAGIGGPIGHPCQDVTTMSPCQPQSPCQYGDHVTVDGCSKSWHTHKHTPKNVTVRHWGYTF